MSLSTRMIFWTSRNEQGTILFPLNSDFWAQWNGKWKSNWWSMNKVRWSSLRMVSHEANHLSNGFGFFGVVTCHMFKKQTSTASKARELNTDEAGWASKKMNCTTSFADHTPRACAHETNWHTLKSIHAPYAIYHPYQRISGTRTPKKIETATPSASFGVCQTSKYYG